MIRLDLDILIQQIIKSRYFKNKISKYKGQKYKQNKIKDSKYQMSNQQQSSIKQYKDFTTITNLRKLTQQSMAPTIKSLQQQMSNIILDHSEMSKKLLRMQDVLKNQELIQSRIDETNKNIRLFEETQAQLRREDERRNAVLTSANEKLFIQMHAMKNGLENQDQQIKIIGNKNNKTFQMYTNLCTNNDKTIKQIQQKYSNFTKQILQISYQIKNKSLNIQNEFQRQRVTYKKQRQLLQQKTKHLELYLSERAMNNQKFDDLYSKIIGCALKKASKLSIQSKMSQLTKQISQILPQSLRKQLPSIQKKLKQIDRIKQFEQLCQSLKIQIKNVQKNTEQIAKNIKYELQIISQQSVMQSNKIKQLFNQKITQICQTQQSMQQKLSERMEQLKLQVQEQMSSMLQKQSSSIYKSISQQLSNKSNNNFPVIDLSGRQQQLKSQILQVKQVMQKIIGRYNKIQEIGSIIDRKLDGYSSKITKIKSDYQLFSDGVRKEICGVIKFRDTFLDRLKDVGKLLAVYTEALLINTSVLIQFSQDDYGNSNNSTVKFDDREPLVFITENDGIIYDWRPDINRGNIFYRRQMMDLKYFLRSYMFSLITFIDDQFNQLSFLNWNQQKPSSFFKQRVLQNYLNIKKRAQSKNNLTISRRNSKTFQRRESIHSSNQNALSLAEQFDNKNNIQMNPLASTTNCVTRTIDSRSKLDRVLEQGDQTCTNKEQIQKNYSIKKPKPQSSHLRTKQKRNDASRYDEIFLTSRSACRSRINQIV